MTCEALSCHSVNVFVASFSERHSVLDWDYPQLRAYPLIMTATGNKQFKISRERISLDRNHLFRRIHDSERAESLL